MIKCASLASGSKGNSFLLQFDNHNFLVDLGISYRQLCQRLQECNLTPSQINAVFITHEHIDHISGLSQFLKKNPVPIFLTRGTARSLPLSETADPIFYPLSHFNRIKLGETIVTVLPTRHDAAEPCAFHFRHPLGSLLHLTDTGEVTDHLCRAVSESDILVIESNHDENMLINGPYPVSLKTRIASQLGHLSNRQTADLIAAHGTSRLRHVFLAHLSEQNNTPSLAQDNIIRLLSRDKSRLSFSAHLTYPRQVSHLVSLG